MTFFEFVTFFDSQNRVTSNMKRKEVLNIFGIKTNTDMRSS